METLRLRAGPDEELEAAGVDVGVGVGVVVVVGGVGGGEELVLLLVTLLHFGVNLDFELLGNLFLVGLVLFDSCLLISVVETVSSPLSISNNWQRSVNSSDSVS